MIVDLDYVRGPAPERLVRAGVGDVLSNFSAVDDWVLSNREQGDPIDRLALTLRAYGGRGAAATSRGRSSPTSS